jgi:predicted hotdog family 3-hydroxylacyl-ACP dehydratase
MKRTDITVEDLLPHRDRMKLVDEIIEVNEKRAVTLATVTRKWPLFKDETVDSLVCIELVAQTAGISNCWDGIKKHGKHFVNRGWLVGIKEAVFYLDSIPVNARITTRSKNRFEFKGYIEIQGTAEIASQVIAEVRLQLMQSE